MTVDRQEIRKRYELVPATSCGYCGWTHVRPEHDENGTLWYRCERDKCGSLSAPRFRGDPSVIALIDSHDAADARIAALEAELVTERAMHSAALERADELGDKLQECEAAGAGMREALKGLVRFWDESTAWLKEHFNANLGTEQDEDDDFGTLEKKARAALSPTAGRELLAELTAYREWVPRAVEAMKVAHEGFRSALACGAQTYQEQREADFAKDAISAALASAPKGANG